MKKIVISLLILSLSVVTGCSAASKQAAADVENPKSVSESETESKEKYNLDKLNYENTDSDTEQKTSDYKVYYEEEINKFKRNDLRAVYVTGEYNEELVNKQNKLKQQDDLYFEVYKSKADLDKAIEKYGLVTKRMISNLNYANEFFDDYTMIGIYPGIDTENVYYYIKKAEFENNVWNLDIQKEILPVHGDEKTVNRGILLEIKNTIYDKTQEITFNVAEKYVGKENSEEK